MRTSILIVDDETAFLNSVERKLRLEGYADLTPVSDSTRVPDLVREKRFDLALLDITMPGLDGLQLLERIKAESPQTECIMVTAMEDIPTVIRAVRLGAYDYLVKPLLPDQLAHVVERALEHKRMLRFLHSRQEEAARETLDNPEAFADMATANTRMLRIMREAELHAQSDIAVLITGETGTGKELLARAVHKASPRAARPFVAVNMLSISPHLFESEFFGHAKGSFTGADRERQGYLARARGGTLFLDEIGDLPLEIQGKLLRILQEREFTPVGKTRPERADVRFVAATNRDLEEHVRGNTFRKDLYYRLRFAWLHLPPLRERKDDLRLLAARFLEQSQAPGPLLGPEAEKALLLHDWPGNVRELKGVLEAASNLAQAGEIMPKHLSLPAPSPIPSHVAGGEPGPACFEPLFEIERRHILAVYKGMDNNKTHAARALGISLATLQRKLKAYGEQ